ncbi:unnamed protein product [Camellia sinensis]
MNLWPAALGALKANVGALLGAEAPIPDSSFPRSPSPYVVNHKRRGGDAVARRAGGFDETPQLKYPPDGETDSNSNGDVVVVVEELVDDGVCGMETGGEDRDEGSVVAVVDDFFDPRCESVSVGSFAGVDDFGKQEYEAVNREMSQRNQEVMEVARRQRQRRKTQRQRWLWDNFFSSAENADSHVAERIPSVRENAKMLLISSGIIYLLEQNAQFLFFNGMHSLVLQTEYPLYQQMLLIRLKFLRMLVTLHDDMEVCYGKTQQRVLICTCEN